MEIFRGAVKMIKVQHAHVRWKRCKERLSEKKRVTKSKRKRQRKNKNREDGAVRGLGRD